MKIWEMPWVERPGARLKRGGPEVLSDAELLAVVLGRGSKTENVIDCSRLVLHLPCFLSDPLAGKSAAIRQ